MLSPINQYPLNSLNEGIVAKRNINYYRLNLVERIGFIDTDNDLGYDDGSDNDKEIQALFPELSFSKSGKDIEITVHLPNRH
jgi:hypothetical protein